MTGRPAGERRSVLRPTVFGLAMAAVVVAAIVISPAVADPSLTGLVWGGLLGVLVLGVVWPLVTVRSVSMEVVGAPTDLVVGQLSSIEVRLVGRASGLSLSCTGSGATVIDAASPGTVRLPFAIARRGRYGQVMVDIGSDAPFGVALARRRRLLDLPRPVTVAPRTIPAAARPEPVLGQAHDPATGARSASGEAVRSVRPYVVGDPAHLVHWPSTARTGALVVRELEPLGLDGLAIVVDLGADGALPPEVLDEAAGRAMGLVEHALDQGGRVLVCTVGPSGPDAVEVPDLLGARRVLAVAACGTPPAPPDGWPVQVVTAAVGPAETAP